MAKVVDLTHLIERLDATEERAGIQLQGLSALAKEDSVTVCGEAVFHEPPDEDSPFQVHIVVYDQQSRVVTKGCEYIGREGIPYDAFEEWLSLPEGITVSKIRLYITG